eukprot:3370150-Amphidinium_carterae.1
MPSSHRCWDTSKIKLLIVHIDVLACLDKELQTLHQDAEARKRALKDLVNPLSEYNTGNQPKYGKVLAIITHTCPSPWQPDLTETPVQGLNLAPLTFDESVQVITKAGVPFDAQSLQNRRAVTACAGHPALLVALRAMLHENVYHLGRLFRAPVTVQHQGEVLKLSPDVCTAAADAIFRQETVLVEQWRPVLQKGLLMMRTSTLPSGVEDRNRCQLACPYPMLVNMLIRQNDALKV